VRKFLIIVGATTSIMVLCAVVALGVLFYQARAFDRGSKSFVDTAVPAIVTKWNEDELLDRATPELRTSITSDQLKSSFRTFSQVGPLIEYEGSQGQWNMSYVSATGTTVSAQYVAKARFQNGDAIFRIYLMRRDGRWLIQGFYVDTKPAILAAART